jgi:2-oxoglutarate ferredoxin oxidoreductase subunit alpha
VTRKLINEGHSVAHAQVRHIRPFPKNFEALLKRYKQVLIPEMNTGQLAGIIRGKYLMDVKQYNKIQGTPIATSELLHAAKELL